jgi:organic hydroperoxide reductase OsmC/OhrA
MEISAIVKNAHARQEVTVRTETTSQALTIPAKPTGKGSAVNGGELLMLALATCYCNDLYREAARLSIPIDGVEVEASAHFPGVGLAATNTRYRARVSSPADASTIADLLRETDAVCRSTQHHPHRRCSGVTRIASTGEMYAEGLLDRARRYR